jgi:hypothetical protein
LPASLAEAAALGCRSNEELHVGHSSDSISRDDVCGVGVERRRTERRQAERRIKASDALDVTRIEHENLATEIAEQRRLLRNIELELQLVRERVNRLCRGLPIGRAGDATDSH